MKNEPDMGKKNQENEQKPEWPREVLITQTLDSIAAELGDDYDEDDDVIQSINAVPAAAETETADESKDKKGSYVGVHSTGFRDFLLKPELLRAIVDFGFEHPSEGKFRALQ